MESKKSTLLSNWGVSSSSGLHLNFLDGLRGIAILMVVAAHAFYYNPAGSRITIIIGKFFGAGVMGVPVFFVLSGFLISYPIFRSRLRDPARWYPAGYALRRSLKVFPPFLLIACFLCVFYYLRFHDPAYFRLGLAWVAGIANFINFETYFNTSFWSLWVEIHFYILLPLLFYAFKKRSLRQTTLGIFTILVVVPAIARAIGWSDGASHNDAHFLMRRFPAALDGFAWGILFAGFYVSREATVKADVRSAVLGYTGLAVIFASMGAFAYWDYTMEIDQHPTRWWFEFTRTVPAVGTFLTLFFAFSPNSFGARLLSSPPLMFVGVVSYEWFLIHQPIFFWIRDLAGSAQGSLVRYAFIVVAPAIATFVIGVAIYRWFSLPIMRWGRSTFLPKRTIDRTAQPS